MKKREKNISVRQLFKKKLGNAEVVPDISVKAMLMKRVARQEFLQFNPGQFNIYYMGGLVLSGIIATLLIFPSSSGTEKFVEQEIPNKLHSSDTGKYAAAQVEKPVTQFLNEQNALNYHKVNSYKRISSGQLKNDDDIPEIPGKDSILSYPDEIQPSISGKGIFGETMAESNMLKSIYRADAMLIEPALFEGCAPLKILFHNRIALYDSCRWTFGDGGCSFQRDPEWIFDVEGEYKVQLKVYTGDGKHLSSDATITVHPRPKAHFEIAPENATLPDDEIHFMNYSTNAVKAVWHFGDGSLSESYEPLHKYPTFANYNVHLVVYSDKGCSDSLTVFNAFSGSEFHIDFPNAFIPNTQGPSGGYYSTKSDEAAQVFHPSFSGVSEFQLKIFSKHGILIFESNDVNLGWDGYHKGQLCDPGVYIWKVRGKFRNGEPYIKMGDVTLLKN